MRINKMIWNSLAAVALIAGSSAVMAQDHSCSDIVWSAEVLDIYPNVGDACDSVVVGEDGKMYARVDATFYKRHNNGEVVIYVHENDGGRNALQFRPQQDGANIDGERIAWRDMYPRQELHFYIPEDRFAVTQDVAMATVAAVVYEEEVMTEEEAEPMPAALPATASNNGLYLVAGLIMLLSGIGLFGAARSRR